MRIAVYVRVSTHNQQQTETIEQQLEQLHAYIQAQGWELPAENIFRNDGYSGATLTRPGLDHLRDRAALAEFDRVLITSPDRLARKYVYQVLILEELERHGCQVEFLERPMSQDPHDQLLLQIRGAVAEYERTLISERMRRGRQAKLRAGRLLPWTRVPYGYLTDPAHPRDPAGLQLNAVEAAVVAELFAWYLEDGVSLHSLSKRLVQAGVPSPRGKKRWNVTTIRGILTNPVYTGTVYAGRWRTQPARRRQSALRPVGRRASSHRATPPEEWFPVASIPAIVSQEHYDLVQAKLGRNQQFAARNNTHYQYLLRSLVSCGQCRLSCFGRTLRSGDAYYVCRGKLCPQVSCRDEKCPAHYIPVPRLDELVWRDLCEVLTHPESIAYALERAHGGHWLPQELQARRENLRRARVHLDHRQERLMEAYLADIVPLEEFRQRRRDLEQKQQALETQERQLEANADRHAEIARLTAAVGDFCQRVQVGLEQATFEQKRQLVELLIDRVIVTEGDVEIRYVIPTSPRSEHVRFCHLRTDYCDAIQDVPETETRSR